MKELSIIFYTANHIEKVRPKFAQAIRDNLIKSIDGEFELVVVSHEPMEFGDKRIVCENATRGHLQIYRNALAGTLNCGSSHVGFAEDDVLYSHDHWRTHRPPEHKVSYDFSKWGINSWIRPGRYGYRSRAVINQLVGPRQLVIDALSERFEKYPDEAALREVFGDSNPCKFWGDIARYEKHLKVTEREWEPFASPTPSVVFSHSEAFGYLSQGTRKSVGEFPRKDLPFWGSAEVLLREMWDVDTEPTPHSELASPSQRTRDASALD